MGLEFGIVGLVIVLLDIWAIINTLGSSETGTSKVVWTIVILALPVIGLLVWAVAGPRRHQLAA